MTAFAAGAGPPANKIATRRKLCSTRGGRDMVEAIVSVMIRAPLTTEVCRAFYQKVTIVVTRYLSAPTPFKKRGRAAPALEGAGF
jgi:hypothetical protein